MSDLVRVKGVRWLPSKGERGKMSDLVRVKAVI